MINALRAGTLYFAIVLAAGFVLGTIRVLLPSPRPARALRHVKERQQVRPKNGVTLESTAMPYATDADLPLRIRHSLPTHAREIFRAAFNAAFKSYDASPRREEIAHRVAWAAVKKRYIKCGDEWIERGAPVAQ